MRHAYILGPTPDEAPFAADGNAAVYMSVVNQTSKSDRLLSAQSPDAKDVSVVQGKPGSTGDETTSQKQAAGESTGIDVPAPVGGGTESDPVLVGQPPYSANTVTLTGLRRELRNGSIVRVTFTFQRAGTITMQLPVVPRTAYRSSLSPASTDNPSETPSENGTGTGTGSTPPGGEAE